MLRIVDWMMNELTSLRFVTFEDGWDWIYENYAIDDDDDDDERKYEDVYVIPDVSDHRIGAPWISVM